MFCFKNQNKYSINKTKKLIMNTKINNKKKDPKWRYQSVVELKKKKIIDRN
jgi:hypothetical protein